MQDEYFFKKHLIKYYGIISLFLLLSACSSATPPLSCSPPMAGDVVYVIEKDWHSEIALPVNELNGSLAFYHDIFPGAQVIIFGYGKRTFFTAPPNTISEYLLGPFPGPAVIQAVGLNVLPTEAYPAESTFILALPPGGAKALSNYIWDDLMKDSSGVPQIVASSSNPQGLFYAAQSRYNLLHTCNTWTANALQSAGFPVSEDGVVFSYQVRNLADLLTAKQCEP